MMYLTGGDRETCFGCEACRQNCPVNAIAMTTDDEGFRYPVIDQEKCMHCRMCEKTCPYEHMPEQQADHPYVFGGYHRDDAVRRASTSGGAFSAVVDAFCDENYVIFGAEAKGLQVFHSFVEDKYQLDRFRRSKYVQSEMGDSYRMVRTFLAQGKKVLFSGTPCQIAGLQAYLAAGRAVCTDKLLTVEVVCEGVPSPLYIIKLDQEMKKRYGRGIDEIDYRHTGRSFLGNGKWDFQQMRIRCGKRIRVTDRWFNPFWSVWLKHYMSRPSCYKCPFAVQERGADITLGDLWGVHLYCPELYGKNGGASLAVANTPAGQAVWKRAEQSMLGHTLNMADALKYQSPMRKHIDSSPDREAFMKDLKSSMSYQELNRKWATKPTLKLLWSKYVWGNRQKVLVWNLRHQGKGERKHD